MLPSLNGDWNNKLMLSDELFGWFSKHSHLVNNTNFFYNIKITNFDIHHFEIQVLFAYWKVCRRPKMFLSGFFSYLEHLSLKKWRVYQFTYTAAVGNPAGRPLCTSVNKYVTAWVCERESVCACVASIIPVVHVLITLTCLVNRYGDTWRGSVAYLGCISSNIIYIVCIYWRIYCCSRKHCAVILLKFTCP